MRAAGFFLFLCISAGLHLLAALNLPEGALGGGPAPGAEAGAELAGADAEIAALVEAWDSPPETGQASELSEARADAAADTTAAEEALAAVEAGAATEALAETDDPGPTPDRPIMAKLPTPNTQAPGALAPRMPAPSLSGPVADTGVDSPASPSPGGGVGAMAALSPSATPEIGRAHV